MANGTESRNIKDKKELMVSITRPYQENSCSIFIPGLEMKRKGEKQGCKTQNSKRE